MAADNTITGGVLNEKPKRVQWALQPSWASNRKGRVFQLRGGGRHQLPRRDGVLIVWNNLPLSGMRWYSLSARGRKIDGNLLACPESHVAPLLNLLPVDVHPAGANVVDVVVVWFQASRRELADVATLL